MNMRHKIILVLAVAGLSACSSFLKEESQSEVIPKTVSDFSELLLGSGYPRIGTGASPSITFVCLLDDDCAFNTKNWSDDDQVETSQAITPLPIYSWQPDMADFNGYGAEINATASATSYAQFYNKILGCNAVLDFIDEAIGTQQERDRVKAEALAVRALLYFQLVNLYGEPYNHNKDALGVPLKLDSDLSDMFIKRATVKEVYEDLIVPDLVEAARLMDPLTIVRGNFRVNQPAIHIILSRVYLYMEKYEECIAEVQKAIEQGIVMVNMVTSLETMYNDDTLLRGYPSVAYSNPEVEWLFGLGVAFNDNAYPVAKSEEFQAIWDKDNDRRYYANAFLPDAWGDIITTKPRGTTTRFGQCVRGPEAYLNRMEAYALSGQEGLALSELNAFRSMRITGHTNESFSGQALLDEIRLERRKELCYEGHRWFDLRRQGMPEIRHQYKFEKGGQMVTFTLKQGDPMYTLPIPKSIMDKNQALEQNGSRAMPERTAN